MGKRKIKKSFEDWCLENNRKDILLLWDYELNNESPAEVSYCSTKKFYFKCPSGRHDSELKSIKHFADGGVKNIHCEQCESFAQYIIDIYGQDYLDNIWSDGNAKTPWDYKKCSKQKVWFVCIDDPTHIYHRSIHKQSEGQKCPYCSNRKIDVKNSLGIKYPKSVYLWSDKNEKSAFEYVPGTHQEVWWKCPDCKHDDFLRSIASSVRLDFRCPTCSKHPEINPSIIDLTGIKFGELTVLSYNKEKSFGTKDTFWTCKCECGKIADIRSSCLLNKGQKTCGDRKYHQQGEGNPNWKGGICVNDKSQRKDLDYIEWRKKSLELDDYTCQCCGERGGDLNVHHIYSFAHYENLRTDLLNGIVLCETHHSPRCKGSLHNEYGCFNIGHQELEEYINNKRKQLGILIPFNIDEYISNKKTQKLSNWIDKLNSYEPDPDGEEPLNYEGGN